MTFTNEKMALCLWFDNEAEEAVNHYRTIFADARVGLISRYGKEGFEFHRKPEGTAMTIEFELSGMRFIALNGGPQFKFNEAASIVIYCDEQEQIDYYWLKLTEGGEEGPCGWLKDRYGVSWQVVPSILPLYMADRDTAKSQRVAAAYLKMKKFDIKALRAAFEGPQE